MYSHGHVVLGEDGRVPEHTCRWLMCVALMGGSLIPDRPLGYLCRFDNDRGYGSLDVSHDASFNDDHVVFDGTLYYGLKVILCGTVIYIHACMWWCGGCEHVV